MFNSVNNPFGQRIESAVSTGQEKQHQQQNQQKDEEKRYLENDEKDEVKIGGLPILTEDDIIYLTQNYIARLKDENQDKPKTIENRIGRKQTPKCIIWAVFVMLCSKKVKQERILIIYRS